MLKSEFKKRFLAPESVLLFFVLSAFLTNAVPKINRRILLALRWNKEDTSFREEQLYGIHKNFFLFVEDNIPENAKILLFSCLDPALIPYYLYPRKIYQVSVDPEINHHYMKLPPSAYPIRTPESLEVDWIAKIFRKDAELGSKFWKFKQKRHTI